MQFFQPTEEFITWMKSRVGEDIVIEIGCGQGDTLRALRKAGVRVLGVDPYPTLFQWTIPEDLVNCYLPGRAEEFRLIRDQRARILVCRPCHTGFPGDVLRISHPLSEMIYVGFEENIPEDVGIPLEKITVDFTVGASGEEIFTASPRRR